MTGLHLHPSGAPVFARSDVGSAYRWDETRKSWTNIVTAFSMPDDEIHWSKHAGVLSIVSAPSDARIAYLAYHDGIFRSRDAGEHWERTNLPATPMRPNDDSSKLSGERLSVDPVNPAIVFFGSINTGLWRTADGGDSWRRVKAIPAGTEDRGVRQIQFDPSSSRSEQTPRVLVMVDGEGVYETKDGGSSWNRTELPVEKPNFYDSEISAAGTLYVCGVDATGRTMDVRRYDGDSWQRVFGNTGHAIGEIALDPFDSNRALLMTHGFDQTFVTLDLANTKPTWEQRRHDREAKNIPWLAWTEGGWFSLGEVAFDPKRKNQLWIAEGTGVWRTSDLEDEVITWSEVTLGQEHLVSNDIVSLPDERALTAHWDRPLFVHERLDEFPSRHQPTQRFNSAWSLDRTPSDPDFIVAIIEDHRYCCYDDGQHRNSGYSEDGGKTWTTFESFPTFRDKESIHGQIAVSADNRDNLVWLPAWNSMPYVTHDRGKTWTRVELPGNSGNCCIAAPWFQRECLVADRIRPATFYIYDWAAGHLFQTSDGGTSWSSVSSVLPQWCYHAKLRSVPTKRDHLWFAPAQQESVSSIGGLLRSTDGGKTWLEIDGTVEVLNIAVGKQAAEATYPTLFIQGRVDGEFGYFKSIDEGQSWSKIGTHPLGIYDVAKVMHADAWHAGRCYVGFGGNGFVYYQEGKE